MTLDKIIQRVTPNLDDPALSEDLEAELEGLFVLPSRVQIPRELEEQLVDMIVASINGTITTRSNIKPEAYSY